MVEVFLELIQVLPKKVQWAVAAILAALLFTFLVFLSYLLVTDNLWSGT